MIVLVAAHLVLFALTASSVLIHRRGRPLSALAWLLAQLLLPGVGPLCWWAIGRTRLRRRLRRHREAKQRVSRRSASLRGSGEAAFDALVPGRAHIDHAYSSGGNQVKLLPDGEVAFAALKQALRNAKSTIHLFYYHFEYDALGREICEILIEKSRAQVEIRLLLDGFGSQGSQRRLKKVLRPHGISVEVFLENRFRPLLAPRLNFVNHRKIAVVDHEVAFTGGMNIAEEYRSEWRDLMVQIRGPAIFALNQTFLEDWFFVTGADVEEKTNRVPKALAEGSRVTMVTSGPDSPEWIHDTYVAAIVRANERVRLVTPYLLPTAALLAALRVAAGRGLSVEIIVPQVSDVLVVNWASRSFYQELIESGVRIFEYEAGMLHAKAMIIDDFCAIGTANLDRRSMSLNFEHTCFFDDLELVAELENWTTGLKELSREVSREALERKSLRERLVESAAHLLSPML